MESAIVAVIGTLGGAIIAGLIQHRITAQKLADRRWRALAEAIPGLLGALVRHREQQWLKVVARRDGVPDTLEARQARYAARSAVTSAMDTLHMATRNHHLIAAAQEAVDAAMALGDADETAVDDAGLRARQAHTALREAGAAHLHRAR